MDLSDVICEILAHCNSSSARQLLTAYPRAIQRARELGIVREIFDDEIGRAHFGMRGPNAHYDIDVVERMMKGVRNRMPESSVCYKASAIHLKAIIRSSLDLDALIGTIGWLRKKSIGSYELTLHTWDKELAAGSPKVKLYIVSTNANQLLVSSKRTRFIAIE